MDAKWRLKCVSRECVQFKTKVWYIPHHFLCVTSVARTDAPKTQPRGQICVGVSYERVHLKHTYTIHGPRVAWVTPKEIL
jgi:hypothetical protein